MSWASDGPGSAQRKLRRQRMLLRWEYIFIEAFDWQQAWTDFSSYHSKSWKNWLVKHNRKLKITNSHRAIVWKSALTYWGLVALTFIPLSEVNDPLLRGAYIRGLGPRDFVACLFNLCVAASAVLSFPHKSSLLLILQSLNHFTQLLKQLEHMFATLCFMCTVKAFVLMKIVHSLKM